MIRQISNKVGGLKNLIFIGTLLVLFLVLLSDIYLVDQILEPMGYFYLFFAIVAVFYGVYPLYANRRLTRYYWERIKKHRLSVMGLVFIIFLIAVALIGPFFTQDPTKVNFEEKNVPPVGFTIQQYIYDLKVEDFVTRQTPGTWKHILGTDAKGRPETSPKSSISKGWLLLPLILSLFIKLHPKLVNQKVDFFLC